MHQTMNPVLDPTTDLDTTMFTRAGEFATRKVAGQTVVVPVRGLVGDLSSVFTLNESGSTIWSLLEGPRRISDLVRALTDEFDVSTEDARADVRDYLARLREAGLIRSSEKSAGL